MTGTHQSIMRTRPLILAFLLAGSLVSGGCFRGVDRQSLHAMRKANAQIDLQRYQAAVVHVHQPVTLQRALELAMAHNLEIWIAEQEHAFQIELASGARLKMLPSLQLKHEESERSELIATSSASITTGQQTLESSYSSEKHTRRFEASVVWDLLDFGVSYLRSRQAGDRSLIAAQRLERVRQRLAMEVTQAWWHAAAATQVADLAEQLLADLDRAAQSIERQIENKTLAQVDGLTQLAPLLEQQATLRRHLRTAQKARADLARLMGVAVDADLPVAPVDFNQPIDPVQLDVPALETEALHQRPELCEQDLEQRISRDDARIALVQMFPSPALFWSYENDRNKFLFHNDWHTVGLKATWDLLSIPRRLSEHQAAEMHAELVARRRLAQAVGILTQLHLSIIDHQQAMEQWQIARRIADKRLELVDAIASSAEQGQAPQAQTLIHRLRYLGAVQRHLGAYADVMAARARILSTIGRDPQATDDPAPITVPSITSLRRSTDPQHLTSHPPVCDVDMSGVKRPDT
jgi:outer membrane protein TolC